jgi:hypothetical protein
MQEARGDAGLSGGFEKGRGRKKGAGAEMSADDWWHWIGLIAAAAAIGYSDTLWKRHSNATERIPERRTIYDFLQTNPRVFYAFWIGALGVYISASKAQFSVATGRPSRSTRRRSLLRSNTQLATWEST